jgi:hypothetical protein
VRRDTMPARIQSMLFSLPLVLIFGLLLGIFCTPNCAGHSVLTHEVIIDAAWKIRFSKRPPTRQDPTNATASIGTS